MNAVTDYRAAFESLVVDERYLRNLDWGEPRSGHPEGNLRAHIVELEQNLECLRPKLSDEEFWKLRLLIHSHDTFKPEAAPGVAIADPRSHASLACAFLAEFCVDEDLLNMVRYHDEPFALWRQVKSKGHCNAARFQSLLRNIHDWSLFLAFNIIDGCTAGKTREPLVWFFQEVAGRVASQFTESDIL